MPLYKTDALILRTYKLGEADRIVVFLTRDRGKKRGVANGARRPRSPLRRGARAVHAGRRHLLRARAPRPGPPELRGVAVLAAAGLAAGRAEPRRVLRRADGRVGAGGRPERAAVPARDLDARGAGGRASRRRRWPATSSTGCCASRASTRRTWPVTAAGRRSRTGGTGARLEPGGHVFTCRDCAGADEEAGVALSSGARWRSSAAAGRVPPQQLGRACRCRRAWIASWRRSTGR